MGRVEKTVFISYRRTNLPWALAIFQNLKNEGYDVFFDYLSIPSGDFENIIVENIKARAHFVVILTPSALERCNEPGDWLRREIETAIDEKRNIIPLMLESFDFGSPSTTKALTGKLERLKKYNGLRLHSEYFFEGMDRLRNQYLNISLETIIHPVSDETMPVIEEHQAAASEAALVEKEQLTAQEWAEKAYVFFEFRNLDEAIRCYNEVLKIEPTEFYSYGLRGNVYALKGDYEKAFADLGEAIRLKPDFFEAFASRGLVSREMGDLENSIKDLTEAIRIMPDNPSAYYSRAKVLQMKGDLEGTIKDYQEALRFNPNNGITRLYLVNVLRDLGRNAEADEQEKMG
jgi:tetratricopeptide (TPR) repeat protein